MHLLLTIYCFSPTVVICGTFLISVIMVQSYWQSLYDSSIYLDKKLAPAWSGFVNLFRRLINTNMFGTHAAVSFLLKLSSEGGTIDNLASGWLLLVKLVASKSTIARTTDERHRLSEGGDKWRGFEF